ncbi:hypothetical protein DPX24_02170 [Pediococcus acidilactici]|nr:hypothetical protein [Pediococcus acidilactici]MCQ0052691.1 hypothetical protein [Pediococcus acidilactici]MCQ0068296.1 hypothetical protein [Pediococcus acidilactici]MCQ0074745.1 hypothetical protein [Pediococcus acidilactici]
MVSRKGLGCGVCITISHPLQKISKQKSVGKTKVMFFKDGKILKKSFGVSAFIEPKANLFRLTKN